MAMNFDTDPNALGKECRLLQPAAQAGMFERGIITCVGLSSYLVRTWSLKDSNPVPREDWMYPHELQIFS